MVRLHDGAHPRLLASHWLWALPRGTILTNETGWDEHLPNCAPNKVRNDTAGRTTTIGSRCRFLDITDPDTPAKAMRFGNLLAAPQCA